MKRKIEAHYVKQGKYPSSNAELGIEEPYVIGTSNTLRIFSEGILINFKENNNAGSNGVFYDLGV